MAFAFENCAGLDGNGRRFDVAYYSGVTEEFHTFGGVNITAQASVDDRGRYDYIRLEFSSLT